MYLLDLELQGHLEHLLSSFSGNLFEFGAADDARGQGFDFGCGFLLVDFHGYGQVRIQFPDSYPRLSFIHNFWSYLGRIWAQALRVIQHPKTSGFELGVDEIFDFPTAFGDAGSKRSEEK